MEEFNVTVSEFNTVKITAGKLSCQACVELEEQGKLCQKCGCGIEEGEWHSRSGSQEALNTTREGAIYKDVEIDRVVEFLRRK